MKSVFFYDTVIGKLGIAEEYDKITDIFTRQDELQEEYEVCETDLIKKAESELDEYFNGNRKEFDFPLNPSGTEFQKKVWKALLDIPYGETRSYKDIAVSVGNPKASRAVGMANNRNPIMIVIPCHRVIGADGSLVGYGGGLSIKEKLLNIERENI